MSFLDRTVMNFKWKQILPLINFRFPKSYCNFVGSYIPLSAYKRSSLVQCTSLLYHTHCPQRVTVTNTGTKVSEYINTNKNEEEHSTKSLKYSLVTLGISIATIGSFLFIKYGSPVIDDDGNVVEDEFSKLPLHEQYVYRCLKAVQMLTLFIQQPSREKLLPDPLKPPYHQPTYTLVLELKNVLVHPDWTYKTGWRFKKRPGLNYLLENLSGLYEIVVFTAEQGMVVFPLCEAIDPKNLISYKLVRDATHFVDGHHVKNLDKLNRDLSKVIVIDYNDESVKFHKDNLFNIEPWNGYDDEVLIDLTAFLMTIANNDVDDVREVLKYYKTFKHPLTAFRKKQQQLLAESREVSSLPQPKIKRSYFY